MKKNWKEYSPREDAWDKIMQKKDFDSQLSKNLNELPEHSPSDFAWNRIEEKLEDKKKGFVWRPFLIAASLTGLFLLAFYQIRQGTVIIDSQQQTDELMADNQSPLINETEEFESTTEDQKPTDSSETILDSSEDMRIQRVNEFIPDVDSNRKINLETTLAVKGMDLTTRGKFVPATDIPQETYHTVAVSWGLQEKTKLRIGTGPNETLGTQATTIAQKKTKPTKKPLTIIIK
mgnify:CR=1 FL=1